MRRISAKHRGYECHLRGYSADIIVHCLHVADATRCRRIHQYARRTSPRFARVSRASAGQRKSKVSRRQKEAAPFSCERIQCYCMQSSHLQVSIPRMHLCTAYRSVPDVMRPLLYTLKGKRWRVRRKVSYQFIAVPWNPPSRSSRDEASEWMRDRAYSSSYCRRDKKVSNYEWRFPVGSQKHLRKTWIINIPRRR